MNIRDHAFSDLEMELRNTRKTLERLPDGNFDWKPHSKSMSVGGLGTHIAYLVTWMSASLEQPEFDFATSPPSRDMLPDTAAVLAAFDKNEAAFHTLLAKASDDDLMAIWTLRHGEHVILKQPVRDVIRTFGINHIIHHRAQLTVCYRLLDIPVPGLYGPSADER